MSPRVIIFGTGDIAQIANYYFGLDSQNEVIGFTVDSAYIKEDQFEGKPVLPFENITSLYPPSGCKMFVALSYAKMNSVRAQKYREAKQKGYELISYVSSHCTYLSQFPPGDNCFIFEDNTIQPFVRIGNNVTIWSGNHIGHHSVIHDHNFISSHVVVSGHCVIHSYCFLGVNSALGHRVTVAERTLLGAGTTISKDTEPGGVYVPARSAKLEKTSDQFDL
jgi:sugar O-acyltransferase (sialic acid O-acetyltransferase NeuD family)